MKMIARVQSEKSVTLETPQMPRSISSPGACSSQNVRHVSGPCRKGTPPPPLIIFVSHKIFADYFNRRSEPLDSIQGKAPRPTPPFKFSFSTKALQNISRPGASWNRLLRRSPLAKRRSRLARTLAPFVAALILIAPLVAPAQRFNGGKAWEYARDFAAIGPRWPTSPGHAKAEAFLREHFQHDQVEEDTFTADTPIGPVNMRNFIVRFPGKKDGAIVLASHYETNYWLRNINFVGANDGAATTGLLMAIADQLRTETAHGKKLDGYSVWLVFFDGEEAIRAGRPPTRPTAAATSPQSGGAMER